MTDTPEGALLARAWVHSHEEDSAGIKVFRSPEHAFPRSRGRGSLELSPNGTAREGAPGPDDRRALSEGTWRQDGKVLTVELENGVVKEFRIESVDADRLVLRPIG
jgi:hypothetical protein